MISLLLSVKGINYKKSIVLFFYRKKQNQGKMLSQWVRLLNPEV
jgi:hypothetical protein